MDVTAPTGPFERVWQEELEGPELGRVGILRHHRPVIIEVPVIDLGGQWRGRPEECHREGPST